MINQEQKKKNLEHRKSLVNVKQLLMNSKASPQQPMRIRVRLRI